MIRSIRRLAVTLLALAGAPVLGGPAAANDSSSELAAGGIVLTKTDAIALQREDLTLSPSEVRVRYEMRNDTSAPVTLRVAFPLPEVPKGGPGGMQTSAGTHAIDIRPPATPNFIGFRVWADGQEVVADVEIRATLPDGRDVADAVRQVGGLPLLLQAGMYIAPDPSWGFGFTVLDAASSQRLLEAGAVRRSDDGKVYEPLWTTWITFHWMQTFRPGVTVIEHSYRPILGGFRYDRKQPERDMTIDAEPGLWSGFLAWCPDCDMATAYCIDRATDRAMRAVYQRQSLQLEQDASHLRAGESIHSMAGLAVTLGYILQTAKNWRGPIGTFHLTLQGGHATGGYRDDDWGEARVFSLCTDLPLHETAPLRFEATAHDYVPTRDLRVLIVTE